MKRRDLLKLLGVAPFLPKAIASTPAPPAPPLGFGTLDFCWHVGEDGIARIYEGDVMVGEFGPATPYTVFTITEDNGVVTYAKDAYMCRQRYFKCS